MKPVALTERLMKAVKDSIAARDAVNEELKKMEGRRLIWKENPRDVWRRGNLPYKGREAEIRSALFDDNGDIYFFVRTSTKDKTGWLYNNTFHRHAHSVDQFLEDDAIPHPSQSRHTSSKEN